MILSKKLLKHKSIKHSFLNRSGGVSTGIYKGMNCGKGSLDQKNFNEDSDLWYYDFAPMDRFDFVNMFQNSQAN